MSNYYETIFQAITQAFNSDKIQFFGEKQESILRKAINNGTAKMPAVSVLERDYYLIDTNQSDVNLKNEIRTGVNLVVTLLSNDVDEVVEMEETLRINFMNSYSLARISDDRSVKQATMILDPDIKISRSSNDILYQTIVPVRCTGLILSHNIVSPIKIELDRKTQLRVMKHLALLEEMYYRYDRQISSLFVSANLNQYASITDKVAHMQVDVKAQYEHLTAQKDALKEQIASMYTFDNLCELTITIDDYGFSKCYKAMVDDDLDINKATEQHKKQKEKEQARKEAERRKEEERKKAERQQIEAKRRKEEEFVRRTELLFGKKGDLMLNIYADEIVADLKKRLWNRKIEVYGGSSFSDFKIKLAKHEVTLPCVTVNDYPSFTNTETGKAYANVDANGFSVYHPYGVDALPIYYDCCIRIYTHDYNQIDELQRIVASIYEKEVTLSIRDPLFPNESRVLKLVDDKDKQKDECIDMVDYAYYGTLFEFNVNLKRNVSVYYAIEYTAKDVANNPRLQSRLLIQAEYALFYGRLIHQEVVNNLEEDYQKFIGRKTSVFGFLADSSFKQLKACYESGAPLNKNLFDSVFSKIVCLYPSLYDKTVAKWSYDQILADVCKWRDQFLVKHATLCNLLEIPIAINGVPSAQPREFKALQYYRAQMDENSYCTAQEAVKIYTDAELAKEAAREEANRRRAEELSERRAENGGKSGSGMFGAAVGAAVGSALSNKSSNNSGGRRNYMGTAGCKYGKKDKNGWTIYCDIRCPLLFKCTQGK